MKVSVVSYSLSHDPASLEEWKKKLMDEIQDFIQNGSEVILYPELFLMGLSKYLKDIPKIAEFVSTELIPEISKLVSGKDLVIVLGSGPRMVNGKIFNSAPVILKNEILFQDKLFLTPWETDFTPGTELRMFNFKGLKTAVVICFDSEQPDLAVNLKTVGIDLMLVPSATTNSNGSNRVNRCASARSVELGAAVFTSPLVGDSECDLVDHNEGRQGFFLPAQDAINVDQETFSEYSTGKHVVATYNLNPEVILELKKPSSETKPFHKPHHRDLKIIF